MSTVKKKASKTSKEGVSKEPEPKGDFMDRFHKKKLCDIMTTNTTPRPEPFDVLRPEPYKFIDYDLSQTDIKLDAGHAKIHLTQAKGSYVPPPPGYVFDIPKVKERKKKPKLYKTPFSSAGPPCWEFVDEIWRREVDERQKGYFAELMKRKTTRLRAEKKAFEKLHVWIYNHMSGPIWYQELSPKQFATINNLKNCIAADLKSNTIINTQENLASLGLVLRPNQRHIEKALKHCCACPVEFLLVLYQLINPKRTSYSMNDRLILSSVVHLTMKETLKEMHIRIPSPPPPALQVIKIMKRKKRQKKKKYSSPYLIPYTFKKPPPKHTGIYRNTMRTYPQSPYFSYVPELRRQQRELQQKYLEEQEKEGSTEEPSVEVSEKEQEILDELEAAQDIYDEMAGGPSPRLLKPSIFVPCDLSIRKGEEQKKDTGEKKDVEISIKVEVMTDYDENDDPISKKCKCTILFEEIEDTAHENYLCHYADNESDKDTQVNDLDLQDFSEDLTSKKPKSLTCTCGGDDEKTPEITSMTAEKMSEDEEVSKSTYKDMSLQRPGGKMLEMKKTDSAECKCKEEVKKIIETAVCQCEKCQEARRLAQKQIYTIAGIKELRKEISEKEGTEEGSIFGDTEMEGESSKYEKTEERETVRVIDAVKYNKPCDCLKKYMEKVKKYEAFKARYDAQRLLKDEEQKFVIGGVYRDEEGKPQYIITGLKQRKVCKCQQLVQNQQEEEERSRKNMPQIPMGRLKYIVSGVRETDEGSVYLVSGVVPIEDCECMKLFKEFKKQHTPCMEAFDEYMQKIRVEVDEYMKEIEEDERFKVKEEPKGPRLICDNPDCVYRIKLPPIDDDLCDNPDCLYREKTSDDFLCDNPECIFKRRPSKEECGNPDCPYASYQGSCTREPKTKGKPPVCGAPPPCQPPPCQPPPCKPPPCQPPPCQPPPCQPPPCQPPPCPPRPCPPTPPPSCCGSPKQYCDNPDCPNKIAPDELCDNPDCLYKERPTEDLCDNPECIYKPQKSDTCSNPICPYKEKEKVSKDICENPICPYQPPPSPPPSCSCRDIETNLDITLEVNKDDKKKKKKNKGSLGDLKRFIMLDKIPCNEKILMEIIKQTLKNLAEDNYPLAKLPDVYKLPHFKLWMQYRCGKYWTIEERFIKYIGLSKKWWTHTDTCQRKFVFEPLPISKKDAKQYTWAQAKWVKSIAGAKTEQCYRTMKQNSLDDTKEFFPTLYMYEFVTEGFRDCFFAYLPSKEEDMYPFKLWMPHEVKDFSGRKICV